MVHLCGNVGKLHKKLQLRRKTLGEKGLNNASVFHSGNPYPPPGACHLDFFFIPLTKYPKKLGKMWRRSFLRRRLLTHLLLTARGGGPQNHSAPRGGGVATLKRLYVPGPIQVRQEYFFLLWLFCSEFMSQNFVFMKPPTPPYMNPPICMTQSHFGQCNKKQSNSGSKKKKSVFSSLAEMSFEIIFRFEMCRNCHLNRLTMLVLTVGNGSTGPPPPKCHPPL